MIAAHTTSFNISFNFLIFIKSYLLTSLNWSPLQLVSGSLLNFFWRDFISDIKIKLDFIRPSYLHLSKSSISKSHQDLGMVIKIYFWRYEYPCGKMMHNQICMNINVLACASFPYIHPCTYFSNSVERNLRLKCGKVLSKSNPRLFKFSLNEVKYVSRSFVQFSLLIFASHAVKSNVAMSMTGEPK